MKIPDLIKALKPLEGHWICFQFIDGLLHEQYVTQVVYLEPRARIDGDSINTVIAESGRLAQVSDGRRVPDGATFPTRRIAEVREIEGGLLVVGKNGNKRPIFIFDHDGEGLQS